MSVASRRLLLGVACLIVSVVQIVQSASLYAAAGLVLGVLTGWALFHFARQLGRVRAIPGATWQDLYRMNTSGSSVVGASVGAALGIFLAGALSVAAPSAQDVFWNWLLGAVAGFAFSLRFSAIGGSAVRIG
jgi:hypothetical protein